MIIWFHNMFYGMFCFHLLFIFMKTFKNLENIKLLKGNKPFGSLAVCK